MLRINEIKLPIEHSNEDLVKKIRSLLKSDCDFSYEIVRRSLDARKKPNLFFSYMVDISVSNEDKVLKRADSRVIKSSTVEYKFPYSIDNISEDKRPVIIGLGPAGLFAGLYLAKAGFRPIIIERGEPIDLRTKTVEEFWEKGRLNPNSNVQFGEGGAGAFSDGKLNTMVKDKYGRNKAVLKDLVRFGAPSEIIYDYKPHVGTDILKTVVKNITKEIVSLGGEIYYQSKVDSFIVENNTLKSIGLNNKTQFKDRNVILAVGHSARDTFELLKECGLNMTPKPFAIGFRVEHSAELINLSQYGASNVRILGNAPYKITHTCEDGRGVYSFCMCPGGYVVNASSEEGRLCVNGMSYYKRDSKASNSAIIITVNPEDYGDGCNPLSGVEFQRRLEAKAYEIGGGDIPIERFDEFTDRKISDVNTKTIDPCVKGNWKHSAVHEILNDNLNKDFIEGMNAFGSKIKGFNNPDTLVMGIEARTSSPIRMERSDICESNIENLFPCGEGAGYAGGITSAAMDGILVAQNVAAKILGI